MEEYRRKKRNKPKVVRVSIIAEISRTSAQNKVRSEAIVRTCRAHAVAYHGAWMVVIIIMVVVIVILAITPVMLTLIIILQYDGLFLVIDRCKNE